ncbi:MAG: hypothetical protein ACRD0Z_04445 [Acidimicrobiales bacterium]
MTASTGWATGIYTTYDSGKSTSVFRIVHTAAAGRTWQLQYSSGTPRAPANGEIGTVLRPVQAPRRR